MFTAQFQADQNLFQKVLAAVHASIPFPYQGRFLDSYKWNEHRSHSELLLSLVELLTDLIWYLPLTRLANGLEHSERAECSKYFFHQVRF